MAKVACIGHTTLDVILFVDEGHVTDIKGGTDELCLPFPSKLPVQKRVITLGGNAPNVGAGLRQTGNEVLLISQYGDDELGKLLQPLLKEWKFDLTHTFVEGESDVSVILSHQGERTILSYHGGSLYRFPQSLQEVDYLYVSSLGFSACDEMHASVVTYFQKHPNVRIVYNPGKLEVARGFDGEKDLLSASHTVIVNKEEAEEMIGYESVDTYDDPYMVKLMGEYVLRGVKNIVITDSGKGAYASNGLGNNYHMPIFPCTVVEKTGAGDAFSSGYMTGLIETNDFCKALMYGVSQSTNVVSLPGATNGLLDEDQLRERIAQNSQVSLRVL
ncbi:carbohydrate kinase family protein [bacterium]|uniref:Carbohydrate kinase PfkB domain-containing protein n=2 Tax=Katanobacteria TaxID=422282 RepID=A0A2M7X3G1_UNCKA|nr:carbohydrate kinase family protein [bacterium]PIP56535.1 MAG: hypothetical protein COX05_02375 [candidate division WWE3 bacterium CG22_combo_CG10-13_8_21_14_all_39_12]PJA40724.1 MAG: hypothetical protein CO179_01510 [candidate division WWE3 bacterium CG_4_9_14_3_um_filter_39_7]